MWCGSVLWHDQITWTTKACQVTCERRHPWELYANPEYFVCFLFSYISYQRLPYENKMHMNVLQKCHSHEGQQLYENFMRTKGRRSLACEKLVRTKNSEFAALRFGFTPQPKKRITVAVSFNFFNVMARDLLMYSKFKMFRCIKIR